MVFAGPDQTITLPETAILSGAVSDESMSLTTGGTLSFSWSKVSGPGTVNITYANPTNQTWQVLASCVFSSPGVYVMRFPASDGSLTGTSDVTITVNPSSGLAITSVSPNSGQPGQQGLSVAITGVGINWVQGTTTANFGDGINVASLTVNSSTSATAILNIDLAASLGSRDVALTTGTEVASAPGAFSVTAAAASITSISPNYGPQGLSGPVAIVGINTHFVPGTTTVDVGQGITVSNVSVSCPTCLTATLAVDPAATPGPRTVTVTTGTEVAILANGFIVTTVATTPVLTSITSYHARSLSEVLRRDKIRAWQK